MLYVGESPAHKEMARKELNGRWDGRGTSEWNPSEHMHRHEEKTRKTST